ncbi:MAG: 1-deoxy-D-xylulose-5-phosphate synthase [Elusimicrobiota bacterium]
MKYLSSIKGSKDLKKLSIKELREVIAETRALIVESISKNGGHLASSLGAADLIGALHYVYNTPYDKIIFDTGHQAYAHKILTGRADKFHTVRTKNGISGFLKRNESEYDVFGAGHASTALSAACGIAAARDQLKENFKVVCVVADGAMTGGMSWEGLQNIGHLGTDMLVVLNDNQMFISHRVGQLGKILTKILTLGTVRDAGKKVELFLNRFQFWGKNFIKFAKRAKVMFFPGMIFEEMGFSYFGPIDGHNIEELVEVLGYLKDLKGPALLHVVTKKGKGYEPAETKPIGFHGTGKFDIDTGESSKFSSSGAPSFTEVFSKTLVSLAQENKKITAITASMPEGTGLDAFRDKFPERYYDVGIAEEHALTFAAGLACEGLKPVVAIYSSFMQRAYDQVMHDICLQKLPVVICMDRAGIVGEDGPTHHGVFDLSLFRNLPDLEIMAPSDEDELRHCLATAVKKNKPVIIRYPRGVGFGVEMKGSPKIIEDYSAVKIKEGKDISILACGNRVWPSYNAAMKLEKEGISASVYYFRYVKPLDYKAVIEAAKNELIVTVEDNALAGGFGSSVLESLSDLSVSAQVLRLGIPDRFVGQGKPSELYEELGLDEKGIMLNIKTVFENKSKLKSAN